MLQALPEEQLRETPLQSRTAECRGREKFIDTTASRRVAYRKHKFNPSESNRF